MTLKFVWSFRKKQPVSNYRPVATSIYKGQAKKVEASILSAGKNGTITVKVTVPAHRSAEVSLHGPN